VNNELYPLKFLTEEVYHGLKNYCFDDKSEMNQQKILGIVAMISSIAADDSNLLYGSREGLYDSWMIKIVRRSKLLFDPLAIFDASLINLFLKLAGMIAASRSRNDY